MTPKGISKLTDLYKPKIFYPPLRTLQANSHKKSNKLKIFCLLTTYLSANKYQNLTVFFDTIHTRIHVGKKRSNKKL